MTLIYENLSASQFEDLVVACATSLFGIGVEPFSEGPDGGRDARFSGRAEQYPSAAEPWTGVTIFQAKHTTAVNSHFSDSPFSSTAKSSTLSEEIKRVKALKEAKELDNYFLVANRRLGANTASEIRKRIAEDTGLNESQIALAGVEYLDKLRRNYPDLLDRAAINPVTGPLLVTTYDLAEVVIAVAQQLEVLEPLEQAPVVDRVPFQEKNRINKMSPEFAAELERRYLTITVQIENVLADPGNEDIRNQYEAAVEEFVLKIISKRYQFVSFDEVFNYLIETLVGRDHVLAARADIFRALLFFMYWNCDIGETNEASSR